VSRPPQNPSSGRVAVGEQRVLTGPSHLAPKAVAAVTLQGEASVPAGLAPAIQSALAGLLLPAGCFPLWPARPPAAGDATGLVAATALALQRAVGCDLEFYGVAEGRAGQRIALVEYLQPAMAQRALRAAVDLVGAAWDAAASRRDPAAELAARLATGLAEIRQRRPRMVFLLMASLQRMGVPWRVVERLTWTLQVGQGARATLLRSSLPGDQSHLGQQLCYDKAWTLAALKSAGLPVPESRSVTSAEAAVTVAEAIGYPVVVKPRGGTLGKGVTVLVESAEEVRTAFVVAARETPQVLVERFVHGEPYRILVIDGRIVDVLLRATPQVVGDGASSIATLIERMNAEPLRNTGDDVGIERFDPEESPRETERCLAAQGLRLDSVPAAGRRVRLGYVPRHRFEICENVTDRIHPEVAEMALTVARLLDLRTAGVDYLSPDIGQPPAATQGAINEVNVAPWLTVHYQATPHLDIVRALMAPRLGESGGRIPLAALEPGLDPALPAAIAEALAALGHAAGHAGPAGAALVADGALPPSSSLRPGRQLLADRRVEAAVIAVDEADIRERGLPFDLCDVALLAAVPGDGPPKITATALARVARRAVVAPLAYAAERRRLELRPGCRLILIGGTLPTADFVPAAGDRLLLRRADGLVLLDDGGSETLPLPPATPGVDPALLAAALLGLEIPAAGLRRLFAADAT